jgi:hypothetical protein
MIKANPFANKQLPSRNALGTGSVSLILVFAVLCLTIFALLTLSSAKSAHTLAHKTADSISDYYQADAAAETILAEIRADLAAGTAIPAAIKGVDINISADTQANMETISYSLAMNERQNLQVQLSYDRDSAELLILSWQIDQISSWEGADNFEVFVPDQQY